MDVAYQVPGGCVERQVVLYEVRRDRQMGGASLRVSRSVRVWAGSGTRALPDWSPLEEGVLAISRDDVRFTGRTTTLRVSMAEIVRIDVDPDGMANAWGKPTPGTELLIIHRRAGQPLAFGSTTGLGRLLTEAAQPGSFVAESLANLADAPQLRATLAQRLPETARLQVEELTHDELDELINFWEEENESALQVEAMINTGVVRCSSDEKSRAQAYARGVAQQCIRLAEEQDRRIRDDPDYQRRMNDSISRMLEVLEAQHHSE